MFPSQSPCWKQEHPCLPDTQSEQFWAREGQESNRKQAPLTWRLDNQGFFEVRVGAI